MSKRYGTAGERLLKEYIEFKSKYSNYIREIEKACIHAEENNEIVHVYDVISNITENTHLAVKKIKKLSEASGVEIKEGNETLLASLVTFDIKNLDLHILNMYSWGSTKKVYSCDDDLVDELISEALFDNFETEIPMAIFNKLPFDSFYVAADIGFTKGFFVHHSPFDDAFIIVIHDDEYDVSYRISIEIPKSSDENATYSLSEFWKREEKTFTCLDSFTINEFCKFKNIDSKELIGRCIAISGVALCIIAYIVSVNADIEQNESTKSRYNPESRLKDSIKGIEEFDVGVKVGKELRAAKERMESFYENSEGTGSKKAPHVRRAHWHHYWTGSVEDGTRELELKWLSPICVNGYYEGTLISSVTPVK